MTPQKFTGFGGSSDPILSPELHGPGPGQFSIPKIWDEKVNQKYLMLVAILGDKIRTSNPQWLRLKRTTVARGIVLYTVQWVDSYFWLLVLESRDSKHKLEVTRLGQVVQNRFQKMNMKK
jgi:hypothetical protein